MLYKKSLLVSLVSCSVFAASLNGAISEQMKQEIVQDLQARKFDNLGEFLEDKFNPTPEHLNQLEEIALQHNSTSLLKAVQATKHYGKIRHEAGFATASFLQAALFFEHSLPDYVHRKKNYLKEKKTGLSVPVEYDRKREAAFIVLDDMKSAYLGEGARKTAYKAIFYNKGKPQMVARAEQRGGMGKEADIMKRLEGAPGVVRLDGFGKHKAKGKKYTTVYTKLYNSKDLKTAFEDKTPFSLYEKMHIALQALKGLDAMHSKHIVHRDIGAQNIFLNIPAGRMGKRAIEAVIADFGWSCFTKSCKHKKAQASIVHTAPEGLYYEDMKKKDYYATDVYALGLVFHRLIYEKKGPNKGIRVRSTKGYYKKLSRRLYREIDRRKKQIQNDPTSQSKEFKLLTLRMISPNPKARGTAKSLLADMERIVHHHLQALEKVRLDEEKVSEGPTKPKVHNNG